MSEPGHRVSSVGWECEVDNDNMTSVRKSVARERKESRIMPDLSLEAMAVRSELELHPEGMTSFDLGNALETKYNLPLRSKSLQSVLIVLEMHGTLLWESDETDQHHKMYGIMDTKKRYVFGSDT